MLTVCGRNIEKFPPYCDHIRLTYCDNVVAKNAKAVDEMYMHTKISSNFKLCFSFSFLICSLDYEKYVIFAKPFCFRNYGHAFAAIAILFACLPDV